MDLHLNFDLAKNYHSAAQRARVVTEEWLGRNMFCPVCGAPILQHYQANKPVGDFFCEICQSDFELKSKESKSSRISNTIADGAYSTMIERITSLKNPHLFVMTHANSVVSNLLFIPNYFFVPGIIIKRPPLKDTARRAGWIGCNIDISNIPESGKIYIIKDYFEENKANVIDKFKRTLSLRNDKIDSRGWLLDVLRCVERIPQNYFTLNDVYNFAEELQSKHPENNFVQAKIRQQLQFLRNKGFIEFISRGNYRKL